MTPARSSAARIAAIGPTGRRACDRQRAQRRGAPLAQSHVGEPPGRPHRPRASVFPPTACQLGAKRVRREAHHCSQRPATRQGHHTWWPMALPDAIHGRRQACRRQHAEALREPSGQYSAASEPLSSPRHSYRAFTAGANLLSTPKSRKCAATCGPVACNSSRRSRAVVAQRAHLAGDSRRPKAAAKRSETCQAAATADRRTPPRRPPQGRRRSPAAGRHARRLGVPNRTPPVGGRRTPRRQPTNGFQGCTSKPVGANAPPHSVAMQHRARQGPGDTLAVGHLAQDDERQPVLARRGEPANRPATAPPSRPTCRRATTLPGAEAASLQYDERSSRQPPAA